MEEDKNQSAQEEFLNEIKKDEEPFEFETPESPKEEEDVRDEKLPYHQDPKLQRYIQKQIAKATEGMSRSEEQKFKEEVSAGEDVVKAFTDIIGNDTPEKVMALQKLRTAMTSLEEKATLATRELEAERQAESQAESEVEDGLEAIEDTYGVDLSSPKGAKLRNDFIDFVARLSRKDEYGEITEYPDFVEAYDIFQSTQVPKKTRAKELASKGMERGSAEAPKVNDRISWDRVERHFDSLRNQ